MFGKCLARSGDFYKYATVTLDLTVNTYSNHMGRDIQIYRSGLQEPSHNCSHTGLEEGERIGEKSKLQVGCVMVT